jgi:hypothetical protein
MEESSRESIGIAECYFCGFRLLSEEQEEEQAEPSSFSRRQAVFARKTVGGACHGVISKPKT